MMFCAYQVKDKNRHSAQNKPHKHVMPTGLANSQFIIGLADYFHIPYYNLYNSRLSVMRG